MIDSIIVYGPQGCGKTCHAEKLRKAYGLSHVYEWEGQDEKYLPLKGSLILTSVTPDYAPTLGLKWVPFSQAIRKAN